MDNSSNGRLETVFSETVSAKFALKRQFSKQVLRIGVIATIGVLFLARHSDPRVMGMLFVAAVLFIDAVVASMMEMQLDIRLLEMRSKPEYFGEPSRLECAVECLSATACALIVLGTIFVALAVLFPPHG